jgi:hypothetical protein
MGKSLPLSQTHANPFTLLFAGHRIYHDGFGLSHAGYESLRLSVRHFTS